LLTRGTGIAVLVGVTLAVIAAALLAPRTAQPLAYHNFADQRRWLGIANFGDVASNVAFAIVGVWGLLVLLGAPGRVVFVDTRERWPYVIVFAGMILVAIGSAYYHLAPDNDRLVWDRLPMALVFMSLVAAMVAERVSVRAGLTILPLLLAVGIASVWQWHRSEVHGTGDLRFYVAVQAYAIVTLLVILPMPPRYTRSSDLLVVVGFYVLAKLLETFDRAVFSAGHMVSGHTLKHLVAAAAGWWILRMLEKRKPVPAYG
jgi:hypothetical protein